MPDLNFNKLENENDIETENHTDFTVVIHS